MVMPSSPSSAPTKPVAQPGRDPLGAGSVREAHQKLLPDAHRRRGVALAPMELRQPVQHLELQGMAAPQRARCGQLGQGVVEIETAGVEQGCRAGVVGGDPRSVVGCLRQGAPDLVGPVERAAPGLRQPLDEGEPRAIARMQIERREPVQHEPGPIVVADLDRDPGRREVPAEAATPAGSLPRVLPERSSSAAARGQSSGRRPAPLATARLPGRRRGRAPRDPPQQP